MRLPAHLLITLLSAAALQAQPVSIFDGKTLDGWDFDPKMWRVEDGIITGGSTTEKIKKNDFISTKKSFHNFELKLKIKCSGDPKTGMINSGIQIRSVREGTAMSGYQVDCGAGWFGKIYDEHRRNKPIWVPTPEQQAALDKAVDVFGWNEYRIRAEGPRIQTWINGVLCIDYTEQDKNIALDGHIAPQVHSGGVCLVQVKDVTIEELPATPGAPTWESVERVFQLVPKKSANAPQAERVGKPVLQRDISYNNVQGTALTAQEQLKKFHLPEGYEIELVVQESEGLGKFVSVYFDQRGRMWTQTALEYPVDANENPAAAEAVYAAKGKDKVLVYPRESLNAKIPAGGLTNATVFADGLAIPLGILPWGAGDTCYVQHGHDLKLYKDTNGDGKADTFDVILTGFGVQDSHLFPHQFTRAPGGWIWMAQGLFNNSKVHKPGSDVVVDYPKCGMARFRPDGSEFEMTSIGPNNIWGLVITGEGETFIQEANDYGYPVMPFHEYAYYPGGMEALKKSYQPDFPPQTDFRMGGTGLSGLALIESGPLSPKVEPSAASTQAPLLEKVGHTGKAGHVMAVANPIISKIQTIAMHRDGAYWKLVQLPDLITCGDPFFRPVALTNGPDGCIYIVDWYNKIISHNEVPRAHPDRDKTRGRIWRVKAKSGGESPLTHPIPDFTKLATEQLIEMLGEDPAGSSHLAWQTLADGYGKIRGADAAKVIDGLKSVVTLDKDEPSKRIMALAAYEAWLETRSDNLKPLLGHQSANIRQQAARSVRNSLSYGFGDRAEVLPEELVPLLQPLADDPSPDVRFEAILGLGRFIPAIDLALSATHEALKSATISALLSFAKPSLPNGPTIQSSRGPKQIPVREAYDREFERFLIRMFLERHPDIVAKFLDSEAAAKLPVEARVLASLALEPKSSASRVAKLLPQLDRAPNDEELLRLAQFPAEAGVGEALKALLTNEKSRAAVAEKLLAQRTKLDAKQIAPLLGETAKGMLESAPALALQLISGFQLTNLESDLVAILERRRSVANQAAEGRRLVATPQILATLRDLRSAEAGLFASIAQNEPELRDAALEALAASRAPDAGAQLLALYPSLTPMQRRNSLNALSSSKAGAKTIVTALLDKKLPQADLDGSTVERLATVLGNDPALEKLQQQLGGIFREVLLLDGQDTAWVDSKITLEGTFTVEAWVRLAPGIGNEDSLLGTANGIQLNFFQSKFRVYAGPELRDVCVAAKPMTPDLWTHLAVTRDDKGHLRIYQNGELDAEGTKPAPTTWKNCQIGWSGPSKGTEGAMMEFRVWKTTRNAAEIRGAFDRNVERVFNSFGPVIKIMDEGITPKQERVENSFYGKGARIAKTIDSPPLLTEEAAKALDAKFAKFTALAPKGDAANGKALSALCMACHQIGNAGGQIGPNLSGAGAMGLEAVLRNILTPNAAMEPGYRIYRVEMKNGDLIDAFFVSEDKDATIIRQPGLPDRRLNKADIRGTQFIRRSLMPEGLLDALPDQQVADLLAYLITLKG
ncbi:MAG: DUF1080 domain-containing protein [Verrucomicrobiaceae bacterium]|nr:DUF1080 domain-containing protein [Verrucomicrobiaceae bacterium]